MKAVNQSEEHLPSRAFTEPDPLLPLVIGRSTTNRQSPHSRGVVVGELIGMTDDGRTPLVDLSGAAGLCGCAARLNVDLHGCIMSAKQVVLVFEEATRCANRS